MITLDRKLCERIAGGSSVSVLANGQVAISYLIPGEILTLNDLQFTYHGCFDMQGNPLDHNNLNIVNGYSINLWYYNSDQIGMLNVSGYRLIPV